MPVAQNIYGVDDNNEAPMFHVLGSQTGKSDPFGKNINLEGTRQMQP